MKKTITIKSEVKYDSDITSIKILGIGTFRGGDFPSIMDCLDQIEEQCKHNIESGIQAASYFEVPIRFINFTITVTGEDGAIIEELTYNDQSEISEILSLLKSLC